MRRARFEEAGEDGGEDQHQQQRMQHRPEKSEERALVADGEIAVDELVQQVEMRGQIAQFVARAERLARGGAADEHGCGDVGHARILAATARAESP